MPNVNESTLGAQIQASPQLRQRIEAIVRNSWWNDNTSNPTSAVPIEDLAWAVAANAGIRTTIGQSLDANNKDWIVATDSVSDQALWAVIQASLARIKALPKS